MALQWSAQTQAAWKRTIHDFEKMERELILATPEAVALFAHELNDAMEREFAPHDRTGKANDPAQWQPNYVHTLQRRSVVIVGNKAVVSWGGGAPYVQTGTSAHVIRAKNKPFLQFKGRFGWVRKKFINHPGQKQDDFVSRAVRDVTGRAAFAAVLKHLSWRSEVL